MHFYCSLAQTRCALNHAFSKISKGFYLTGRSRQPRVKEAALRERHVVQSNQPWRLSSLVVEDNLQVYHQYE